jgi:hypothetical protein
MCDCGTSAAIEVDKPAVWYGGCGNCSPQGEYPVPQNDFL